MSTSDAKSKDQDDLKKANDVMNEDDDDVKNKGDGADTNTLYECLGDALDAMDRGVEVDLGHLRELAKRSIGPFESELAFETADGKPISIDVPCEKNPGHESFFPVSDFKPENIPERHRTKRFYDTILAWSNLVVKVVVKRVSRNRPEVYSDMNVPFPENRFRGTTKKIRYGTGYVVSRFGPNQPYRGQVCPCHLCRNSGQRREFWSLNIATVTHVIYDSSEARDSVFEFFYDSEDKKAVDFMYGTDSFEQVGKSTEKMCIVRCVTHDRRLYKRLFNLLAFCQSMSIGLEEPNFENDPVVMISHPHGKCKCVSIGSVADFRVPTGKSFPVNRPITFTRTAECRLPLFPWLQRSNPSGKDTFDETSDTDDIKDNGSLPTCSRDTLDNSTPLPSPLTGLSNAESFFEAQGGFVINTGKNQKILSPGMFKRESDSRPLALVENQNSGDKGDDLTSYNLDNFLESLNFRCINVDDNDMYTLDDIYFGNPQEPRDMRLGGLVKPPNQPEPHVPIRMDVQSALSMYDHCQVSLGMDLSKTDVKQDDTAQPCHTNLSEVIDETLPKIVSIEKDSDDPVSNKSAMTVCTEAKDIVAEVDEELDATGISKYNNNTTNENDRSFAQNLSLDTAHSKNDSSENVKSFDVSAPGCEKDCSLQTVINDKEPSLENANDTVTLMGSSELEKPALEVEDSEESGGSNSEDHAIAGETADLSIPEMIQILLDKGFDLFPKNNDNSMSSVDELNLLFSAMQGGDGLPLMSVLNKIYENVATKNTKPLILEPGSQFNLPEGMTFTLPKNSKYALRFHDLTSSWFSFPPDTTFHTSEGQHIEIPDDAEFSFKFQSVLQGFLTYKLDSCPGSSGGLVLLGKGMRQTGSFSHSGQFDVKKRENRSSLRSWMIFLK